jgi:hypothetical protein
MADGRCRLRGGSKLNFGILFKSMISPCLVYWLPNRVSSNFTSLYKQIKGDECVLEKVSDDTDAQRA